MNWPYPRVIAHRGGGTLAPENTLAAMKKGVSLGVRGVEFDVKLAADATLFLMHDDTLERTTNGKGAAGKLSYAELAKLDAGSWFSPEHAGEPVPRFETVAKFLVEHRIAANVEIKPGPGQDEDTGKAVAIAARGLWQGAAQMPLLTSFSAASLRAAKSVAPELLRGWIVREIPQDWADTARELGCFSMSCKWSLLTKELAADIKSSGHGLLAWTVNDTDAARRMFEWGVDAVVTDRVDLMLTAFG